MSHKQKFPSGRQQMRPDFQNNAQTLEHVNKLNVKRFRIVKLANNEIEIQNCG